MKSSAPKVPTPRWKRRPEERPDEILCAAVTVFGEVGFARAKLEDVAKAAGVSKGTLYLYFDSKDALFRAMVKAKIVRTFEDAEARLREFRGNARERLAWFIGCMWESIRQPEMVSIARVVHAELANFPELARFYFDEVILRTRGLLRAILEPGIASGEFRPVSHAFALRAIPSLLVHGTMYQRGFGRFDPDALTDDQVVEGVLDLVLNGVVARTDAGNPKD